MNKSPYYNQQQTEPKQCKSEVEELRIHQTWKLAIAASISENNARENFSEETIYI